MANFNAMASARAGNRIADGGETGSIDMVAAEQIGVTLGDTPAPKQAKPDHKTPQEPS